MKLPLLGLLIFAVTFGLLACELPEGTTRNGSFKEIETEHAYCVFWGPYARYLSCVPKKQGAK